jgi:hypothetical protein
MSLARAPQAWSWNGYTPLTLAQAQNVYTLEPPHDPEA